MVPATVAWNTVLIDTGDVLAYVPALRVYPSGFRFTVTALLRPTASEQVARDFADGGVISFGPRVAVAEEQIVRGLRVGVEFADGRRAVLDRNRMRTPRRAGGDTLPIIGNGRWSSDDGIFEWEVHVIGIPEEGPVRLYHQWLALDVAEASTEIDGDALRSASARAVELWPPEASGAAE